MPPHGKNGPTLWVDYFGPLFSEFAENDRLSWSVADGRGDRKIVTAHFNDASTVIQVESAPSGTDFAVYAGGGDDSVISGIGSDRLYGEDGHDYLSGGGGGDLLDGGAGDDELVGGSSNDQLWGGSGNDTFMFYVKDSTGSDGKGTIRDFVAGDDALHFYTVVQQDFHHTIVTHAGNFANYAETPVAPGTGLATVEAAADALFATSSWYKFAFVADGTDGYLFVDIFDGPPVMITLKGIGSVDGFSFADLV
jgi:Ca2+-binding RTX toxin-like protein